MADNTPPNLTAGQKVGAGRFTLIRQLGRGGMGGQWERLGLGQVPLVEPVHHAQSGT